MFDLIQEKAEERWRPILSVEAIIVSVVSMLSNPNDESPANIDAAVRIVFCSCFISFRSCGEMTKNHSIEGYEKLCEEAKKSAKIRMEM